MAEETIPVGAVSRGERAGRAVELPIVDLLTGRGFITGKSGSGKSNSASVVAEKLLDRGYSLLAVDVDGEYYGLKEDYEILHVGGDDECDLQVTEEHAGKIAELALEQNVPIILDVSSFLDESKARDLLTAVTKRLFAKEKKLKQPFMMLVEEVHEYIPEGSGMDECGRMLIKVGKRGRKHGLGIVGISQRPADVKKDFITQCDWLVWHRLTWNNDTKVVGRILGSEYADYIEEMADGECFLQTDWSEDVKVVQFERKRTFDAGATPGLDDFERPELKSVSGDLVEELEEITEAQERRESRIEELERELETKDERIHDLEEQLSEARDLERMADRFSRAMMEQVTGRPLSVAPGRQSELDESTGAGRIRRDPELEAELDAVRNGDVEPRSGQVPDAGETRSVDESDVGRSGVDESMASGRDADSGTETTDDDDSTDADGLFGGIDADALSETGTNDDGRDGTPTATGSSGVGESTRPTSVVPTSGSGDPLVTRLRDEIYGLDDVATEMLRHYRAHGPTTPQEANAAAGGSGDRTEAYAANRALRRRGLVEHVGCGQHDYALPSLVVEESRDPFEPGERIPDAERDRLVAAVESAFVDGVDAPKLDRKETSEDGTAAASSADASSVATVNGDRSTDGFEPWPEY